MTVQTVKLGGKRFVILPEKDYQQMSRALDQLSAQDQADIRLARNRLADPKETPLPYAQVRKELGLV